MKAGRSIATRSSRLGLHEGIVIYHEASRQMFKKTLENDESPKSLVAPA